MFRSFDRGASVKKEAPDRVWIRSEADSFHLDSKLAIEASFETFDVSLFQVVRRSEDRTNILNKKHSHKMKERRKERKKESKSNNRVFISKKKIRKHRTTRGLLIKK